jgi:hypothetical protein
MVAADLASHGKLIEQMVEEMKTMNSSINTELKDIKGSLGDLSSSMDKGFEDLRGELLSRIEDNEKRIDSLESRFNEMAKRFESKIDDAIKKLNDRMTRSENLSMYTYLAINSREQRQRGFSVRATWYVDLAEKGKLTARKIYQKIIRPALEEALAEGEIEWLPDLYSRVVEAAHVIPNNTGDPPSWIFRFHSRDILFAFMKFKATYVDLLNEANEKISPTASQVVKNGSNRVTKFVADKTMLNRDLMSWLWMQHEVKGVKISGTRVCFLREGSTVWKEAKNPFARTLDEVETLPFSVQDVLRQVYPDSPFLATEALARMFESDVLGDGEVGRGGGRGGGCGGGGKKIRGLGNGLGGGRGGGAREDARGGYARGGGGGGGSAADLRSGRGRPRRAAIMETIEDQTNPLTAAADVSAAPGDPSTAAD